MVWISDLLCVGLDHDVAVDEDGTDDGEGEERVGEDVDGDPPDGVEGGEEEHGLLGGEAKDGAPLRDDDERLLVVEVRVDVADRRRRKLQRKVAEATGKIVTWRGKRHQCFDVRTRDGGQVRSYPAPALDWAPDRPHRRRRRSLGRRASELEHCRHISVRGKKSGLVPAKNRLRNCVSC